MQDWEERLSKSLRTIDLVFPNQDDKIAASVLIPIGLRQETMRQEILLTKRSEKVETHKGQISFPGGLFEARDNHLLRTALRETEEEVGLTETHLHVLGALSPVQTLRDVVIYPWVAKVEFPKIINFNPDEVERPLFLSLQQLLSEGLKSVQVPIKERGLTFKVSSLGITCENELIWGASAKILEQLYLLLK